MGTGICGDDALLLRVTKLLWFLLFIEVLTPSLFVCNVDSLFSRLYISCVF